MQNKKNDTTKIVISISKKMLLTLPGKGGSWPQMSTAFSARPISSCVSLRAVLIKSSSVSSSMPPGKLQTFKFSIKLGTIATYKANAKQQQPISPYLATVRREMTGPQS